LISGKHPNRRAHNWLIYSRSDQLLERYSSLYKGVLYDLGAGESPYRDFFLRHADAYVAIDWSGSLHETKPDIEANLNEALPIDSEVADTVVSLSVLEHLCEPQTMLNEAFRVLRPGGAIVLQVPFQWSVHEAPHDHYRYTPYGLEYIFKKAGFQDIRVEPQAGFFTMTVLKWNYFTLRFVAGPRPVRILLTALLSVFWHLGQLLAPLFDKLDRNWELEAPGYFVTARKP
jgi:SAM-dependent methyltransferase